MQVHEIIKKYLDDNGYDGLYSGYCWCKKDDLAPCYDIVLSCKAGYMWHCNECKTPCKYYRKNGYCIKGIKQE